LEGEEARSVLDPENRQETGWSFSKVSTLLIRRGGGGGELLVNPVIENFLKRKGMRSKVGDLRTETAFMEKRHGVLWIW